MHPPAARIAEPFGALDIVVHAPPEIPHEPVLIVTARFTISRVRCFSSALMPLPMVRVR